LSNNDNEGKIYQFDKLPKPNDKVFVSIYERKAFYCIFCDVQAKIVSKQWITWAEDNRKECNVVIECDYCGAKYEIIERTKPSVTVEEVNWRWDREGEANYVKVKRGTGKVKRGGKLDKYSTVKPRAKPINAEYDDIEKEAERIFKLSNPDG